MGIRDKFEPEYREIVAALVALRHAAGLNQTELAERMHVDQTAVSKYERSERRIDIVDFIRWCKACSRSPGALLDSLEQWDK